jgi:uncharacterized metal-binding protein YceD (DUF177 family)
MPLTINLKHLEAKDLLLKGELPVEDLDIQTHDEIVQAKLPLEYDIRVQKMESNLLITGILRLVLDCECVRCLKPHQQTVELPEWACHIPLIGEDAVAAPNDTVDLTPFIREDILLEFPQHPLCEAECSGLPEAETARKGPKDPGASQEASSAWSELNKLKF